MSIAWDDSPSSAPRRSGLPIQIFWLPAKGQAFIRFLGHAEWLWVHFVEGRTKACSSNCPWCNHHDRFRKAYAPALWWKITFIPAKGHKGEWVPIVADIPEGLADQLPDQLRGVIIDLKRPGPRRNSPLECTVLDEPYKGDLPPAFDVRPIVEKAMGVRRNITPKAEGDPAILPFNRRAN